MLLHAQEKDQPNDLVMLRCHLPSLVRKRLVRDQVDSSSFLLNLTLGVDEHWFGLAVVKCTNEQ